MRVLPQRKFGGRSLVPILIPSLLFLREVLEFAPPAAMGKDGAYDFCPKREGTNDVAGPVHGDDARAVAVDSNPVIPYLACLLKS